MKWWDQLNSSMALHQSVVLCRYFTSFMSVTTKLQPSVVFFPVSYPSKSRSRQLQQAAALQWRSFNCIRLKPVTACRLQCDGCSMRPQMAKRDASLCSCSSCSFFQPREVHFCYSLTVSLFKHVKWIDLWNQVIPESQPIDCIYGWRMSGNFTMIWRALWIDSMLMNSMLKCRVKHCWAHKERAIKPAVGTFFLSLPPVAEYYTNAFEETHF